MATPTHSNKVAAFTPKQTEVIKALALSMAGGASVAGLASLLRKTKEDRTNPAYNQLPYELQLAVPVKRAGFFDHLSDHIEGPGNHLRNLRPIEALKSLAAALGKTVVGGAKGTIEAGADIMGGTPENRMSAFDYGSGWAPFTIPAVLAGLPVGYAAANKVLAEEPPDKHRLEEARQRFRRALVAGTKRASYAEMTDEDLCVSVMDRLFADKEASVTDTVSLAVLKCTKSNRFLLVQKRDDDEKDPGKWGFCGGHMNGGETAEETLDRETHEETGLRPTGCEEIESLRSLTSDGTTLVFYKCAVPEETCTLNPNELQDARWVTPAEAKKLDIFGNVLDAMEAWGTQKKAEVQTQVQDEGFHLPELFRPGLGRAAANIPLGIGVLSAILAAATTGVIGYDSSKKEREGKIRELWGQMKGRRRPNITARIAGGRQTNPVELLTLDEALNKESADQPQFMVRTPSQSGQPAFTPPAAAGAARGLNVAGAATSMPPQTPPSFSTWPNLHVVNPTNGGSLSFTKAAPPRQPGFVQSAFNSYAKGFMDDPSVQQMLNDRVMQQMQTKLQDPAFVQTLLQNEGVQGAIRNQGGEMMNSLLANPEMINKLLANPETMNTFFSAAEQRYPFIKQFAGGGATLGGLVSGVGNAAQQVGTNFMGSLKGLGHDLVKTFTTPRDTQTLMRMFSGKRPVQAAA